MSLKICEGGIQTDNGRPVIRNLTTMKPANSCLSRVVAAQNRISILEDTQVELHLLRSLQDSPPTSQFTVLHPFLEQFDLNLKTCLSRVLQCSLPSDSWCQATLSFRLGGLGLHSSSHAAATAFLGSCNSTCLLLGFCL